MFKNMSPAGLKLIALKAAALAGLSIFLPAGAEEEAYLFRAGEGLKPIKTERKNKEKTDIKRSSSKEAAPGKEKINPEKTKAAALKEAEQKESSSPSNSLEAPKHSISEDFAPEEKEETEGEDFVDAILEDSSWFFQDKNTSRKIGLAPIYSYDRTKGARLGLRLFFYSPNKKGFYLGFAGSQYLMRPFTRLDFSYISGRAESLRTESSLIYDNHYENYYGEGMDSRLSDPKKLYAHRFQADWKVFYNPPEQAFYTGFGLQFFFRSERPAHQENKIHFEKEGFFYITAFAGYDSRKNWKNPSEGAFHNFSIACKPILDLSSGYCRGEGDLRFYIPLFKNTDKPPLIKKSILALRAFAGSAFFSESSYSSAYSLGGQNPFQPFNAFRGFKQNRFRGDKVYFLQAEARFPIWGRYISGALFSELGEAALRLKKFEGPVLDMGGSLFAGIPPGYDMKIRIDFAAGKDRQKETNYNFIIAFFHAF